MRVKSRRAGDAVKRDHGVSCSRPNYHGLPVVVLVAGLLMLPIVTTADAASLAGWSPNASERLMKLPGETLKRAVESDYRRSDLARALSEAEEEAGYKKATLGDLKAAIERSEGEVRRDLEMQFLEEKRTYIGLLKEQQDMRARRAEAKKRLYEKLLSRMKREQRAETPAVADLRAKQESARKRLQAVVDDVDIELIRTPGMQESRYGRDYAKNVAAIQTLVHAIDNHPMNQAPMQSGLPISQEEYLRQLISENQAELALIDQEREVLGYMAKLVSLDALDVPEDIELAEGGGVLVDPDATAPGDITAAVELFVE